MQIFRSQRRLRWPGEASVIVAVVHAVKSMGKTSCVLDGRDVVGINSFLFPSQDEFDAVKIKGNPVRGFRGCDIYGSGFIFEDKNDDALAGSLQDMRDLIARDPKNQDVVYPYLGGKEITTAPQHRPHRYVINFADMELRDARNWPELLEIVEAKVKPHRDTLGGYSVAERRRDYWWQYGTYTPALFSALSDAEGALAISQTTSYICFAVVPKDIVFGQKAIVIPARQGLREFSVLSSRIHEAWALLMGSTQGETPVYSPADGAVRRTRTGLRNQVIRA
jgi:hypothetical protein